MSCELPNFQNPANFRFTFERAKPLQLNCQTLTFPSVSGSPSVIETPFQKINIGGSTLQFYPITFDFVLTDGWTTYKEVFAWMRQINFPSSYAEFKDTEDEPLTVDGTVLMMDSFGRASQAAQFKDCFPLSLGSIYFDTRVPEPRPITVPVTFAYTDFNFI